MGLCVALDGAAVGAAVGVDELTLFVDPVDGTREFVEGRLENVQVRVRF